jgi:hypothetical protein
VIASVAVVVKTLASRMTIVAIGVVLVITMTRVPTRVPRRLAKVESIETRLVVRMRVALPLPPLLVAAPVLLLLLLLIVIVIVMIVPSSPTG